MFGEAESTSNIYCSLLTASIFMSFQQILLDANDYCMSIHRELGLKRGQLAATKQSRIERTLKT